jgi:PKD repeat protein
VDDGAGLANSAATAEVRVTVNPPPAPAIAGPAVACVGESVAWKAGSNAASYAWSFGDGASADTADAGHAYQKPGRYSLALLEDDGKGLANSRQLATRMIHVNQPPRADAGPDQRACPGSAVTFDASASADADGKVTAYRWDFGDGSVLEGEKVQHAFAKPGTYAVRLTVTDDAGSSCSTGGDEASVVVDAPPVADAGTDREVFIGGANDAVLLDGSASHDPDGEALTHSWAIGDGSSEQGERVRHTFLSAGDYPVTLTVSDTSGLACGTASTTVHIVARQRH